MSFSKRAEPLRAYVRIRPGFQNCGNIFTKDQRILKKNENLKFEIYFLTYKHLKKGIFKGASPDGKNKFFIMFLSFRGKYMSFWVEPPLRDKTKVEGRLCTVYALLGEESQVFAGPGSSPAGSLLEPGWAVRGGGTSLQGASALSSGRFPL